MSHPDSPLETLRYHLQEIQRTPTLVIQACQDDTLLSDVVKHLTSALPQTCEHGNLFSSTTDANAFNGGGKKIGCNDPDVVPLCTKKRKVAETKAIRQSRSTAEGFVVTLQENMKAFKKCLDDDPVKVLHEDILQTTDQILEDIKEDVKKTRGQQLRHVICCGGEYHAFREFQKTRPQASRASYVRFRFPDDIRARERAIFLGAKIEKLESARKGLKIAAAFAIEEAHNITEDQVKLVTDLLDKSPDIDTLIQRAKDHIDHCEREYAKIVAKSGKGQKEHQASGDSASVQEQGSNFVSQEHGLNSVSAVGDTSNLADATLFQSSIGNVGQNLDDLSCMTEKLAELYNLQTRGSNAGQNLDNLTRMTDFFNHFPADVGDTSQGFDGFAGLTEAFVKTSHLQEVVGDVSESLGHLTDIDATPDVHQAITSAVADVSPYQSNIGDHRQYSTDLTGITNYFGIASDVGSNALSLEYLNNLPKPPKRLN